MKSVIIIPTYNERDNVHILLDALHEQANRIPNHPIEYVIVDDTSPDGTADVVRSYQKNHKDVFMITGKKEGLGRALLRGMTYAVDERHADVIVQMDCDLSHDPSKIPEFLKAVDNGYDFVVGSRYIKGGSIPDNWGLLRKIYSIGANAIVRYGLGYPRVHDWSGGYRAYKKKYYEMHKDQMRQYSGYLFQIAFLHKAIQKNATIIEIPFHFEDRKYGSSKIIPGEYIKSIFYYIIQSRWDELVHGTFGKFLIVGTIGFIINTIVLYILASMGVHPAIGSACGAELAIISNFILNNNWTFRVRKVEGSKQIGKFFQFNLTSLGALAIQSVTVYLGTIFFGRSAYFFWYLVGVGLGLMWNYTMYSRVIWKKNTV